MKDIKQYLEKLGIKFKVHTHPAVFTCEDAKEHYAIIPGIHSKNLFVKSKKRFYLIILPFEKRLNTKEFEKTINEKISFGNAEELKKTLDITPGSVSPFALINDTGKVKLFIDEEVWNSDIVSFHPNINTETIELSGEDLHKYIKSLKNEVEIKLF